MGMRWKVEIVDYWALKHLGEIVNIEREVDGPNITRIVEMVEQGDVFVRVATCMGHVAGWVHCVHVNSLLEISRLTVASSFRRGGVGTKLVGKVLEHAEMHWFLGGVECCVPESNLPAQLFFKSLDFTAEVEREAFGEDDGYRFRNPVFVWSGA